MARRSTLSPLRARDDDRAGALAEHPLIAIIISKLGHGGLRASAYYIFLLVTLVNVPSEPRSIRARTYALVARAFMITYMHTHTHTLTAGPALR